MANAGLDAGLIVVKFDTKTIGELVGVSHDGISVAVIDISSSADTAHYRDFIPGKKDPGTLELKIRAHAVSINSGDASPLFWIALGRDDLELLWPLGAGQTVNAKLACKAFCIKDTGPMGELDAPAERTLAFKLCSQPTFTAGS